jgi:hypothetical protein
MTNEPKDENISQAHEQMVIITGKVSNDVEFDKMQQKEVLILPTKTVQTIVEKAERRQKWQDAYFGKIDGLYPPKAIEM